MSDEMLNVTDGGGAVVAKRRNGDGSNSDMDTVEGRIGHFRVPRFFSETGELIISLFVFPIERS
jgi:hypothetical protein